MNILGHRDAKTWILELIDGRYEQTVDMRRRFQVRVQDAETHDSTEHAGVQYVRVRGTVALQALVHEAVQQRAAVVTEGGTRVGLVAEPVLRIIILKLPTTS